MNKVCGLYEVLERLEAEALFVKRVIESEHLGLDRRKCNRAIFFLQNATEHFHGIDFLGNNQVCAFLGIGDFIAGIVIGRSRIVRVNVAGAGILDAFAQRGLGSNANHFLALFTQLAEKRRKVGITRSKHNPLHLGIKRHFHRIDRHLDVRRILATHRVERVYEFKAIFVERGLQRDQLRRRPFAISLAHDNLPKRQKFVHKRLYTVIFDPVGQVLCVDKNCNVVHERIYSKVGSRR